MALRSPENCTSSPGKMNIPSHHPPFVKLHYILGESLVCLGKVGADKLRATRQRLVAHVEVLGTSLVPVIGTSAEERKILLLNFIDACLPLSDEDENEFRRLLAIECKEISDMLFVYEERGILRGKREMLLKLMRRKFGTLPESVEASIRAVKVAAELDRLAERMLDAPLLRESDDNLSACLLSMWIRAHFNGFKRTLRDYFEGGQESARFRADVGRAGLQAPR